MAQIAKERMAAYRATAQRQWQAEQRALRQRRQRAWHIARQAANLLRERFSANRVVVFGSLVDEGLFHSRSDVDLGVWGLDERIYYYAVAQVLALAPDIAFDLVRVEQASPALSAMIEQTGVDV